MATSTFSCSAYAAYRNGNRYQNSWRVGYGITDTTSLDYARHPFFTLLYFNASSIQSALAGNVLDSAKLTLTTGYIYGMDTEKEATVYAYVTNDLMTMPDGNAYANGTSRHFSYGMNADTAGTYLTPKLGSFVKAKSGKNTVTIASGTKAVTLGEALKDGNPIALCFLGSAQGAAVYQPGGWNLNYGTATPTLTLTYHTAFTACDAPTSVAVSDSAPAPSAEVTLSWSGAAAGTSNAITGYQIYRAETLDGTYSALGSAIAMTETAGSATVIAPASVGQSFFYKLVTLGTEKGYDSAQSAANASVTATAVRTTAPTVVNVSTPSVTALADVRLYWAGATAGGSAAIAGYRVYRAEAADGTYTLLTSVETDATGGGALVTAPSALGNSYFYKVQTLGDSADYDSAQSEEAATLSAAAQPTVTGGVGKTNAEGWR